MALRKLRALIGMPVLCGSRRIGRVVQPQLTEDLTQLKGIWISAGLGGTRFVPCEALEMIGTVAVLTDDRGSRGRMKARPLLLRAVSTDGRRIGAITGAEIDEVSFAVNALELSAGLWEDLLMGRARVTRYSVNAESGEVIIDPAADEREENAYEGRIDEGADRGHADRRLGGDDLRRHELADGAQVEPEGQADRQLDLRSRG